VQPPVDYNADFVSKLNKRKESKDDDSRMDEAQIRGIIQGVTAVWEARLDECIKRLKEEDKADDDAREAEILRKVEEMLNERMLADSQEDRKALTAMMLQMVKPRKRSGVVDLPNGKVKMTITEE